MVCSIYGSRRYGGCRDFALLGEASAISGSAVYLSFIIVGVIALFSGYSLKDFALAEPALPFYGHTGFVIVAITALISTASSINASLYAVTNVTYQLAKDGELPIVFGAPIAHSREVYFAGFSGQSF